MGFLRSTGLLSDGSDEKKDDAVVHEMKERLVDASEVLVPNAAQECSCAHQLSTEPYNGSNFFERECVHRGPCCLPSALLFFSALRFQLSTESSGALLAFREITADLLPSFVNVNP